jgi:putative addiction module component (TIGR02574 family)
MLCTVTVLRYFTSSIHAVVIKQILVVSILVYFSGKLDDKKITFNFSIRQLLMRTDELKIEIGKLDLSDKLLLVESVWDEIAESNKQLPLTEWQEKELEKRLALYDSGETETSNWNEVHETLRTKYK